MMMVFDFHFLAVVFFVTGMPVWLIAIAGCMWGYWDLKGKKIIQEKEVSLVITEAERKEDRRYAIGIAIILMLLIIGNISEPIYASLTKKKFTISKEWQEQIVANQNIINEAKQKIEAARKDSKSVLDKILEFNGIEKLPGINYELRYEVNKWKLYQQKM